MRATSHRRGGADDGIALRLGEQAQMPIDHCGGGFDQRQGADERGGHRPPRDVEIVLGTLGLRAPQRRYGHPQLAHAVVLDPKIRALGHASSSCRST